MYFGIAGSDRDRLYGIDELILLYIREYCPLKVILTD
jgi:hypothetical protein